jgi:hypothetical protein
MMDGSMFKSAAVLGVWIITVPSVFSIATSIVAMLYFGSMLKIKVIDKRYKGSWLRFFKSMWQK